LFGGGPGGPKGEIPATIARNSSATRAGSSKQATANAGRWEIAFFIRKLKRPKRPNQAVKDSKIFETLPQSFINYKRIFDTVLEINC